MIFAPVMSTRDLTTLSNIGALPAVAHLWAGGRPVAAAAVLLAMGFSIAFHATEGESMHVFGMDVHHHLDEGYVVRHVFPARWMRWGKEHSNMLLRLDEAGALMALVVVCISGGGFGRVFSSAYRECTWSVVLALLSLALSDLCLDGWAHAVVHTCWHGLVFTLPVRMSVFAASNSDNRALADGRKKE
uniref:Uncharacterized protein n=1 Tax=Lotharella oceanica TaxID=641309 RepID=A0A7S2TQL4_9EUKA